MHIECATVAAAEQVLTILMQAQLRPRQDFEVRSGTDLLPPITFTFRVMLPTALLSTITALSGIAIAQEAAT